MLPAVHVICCVVGRRVLGHTDVPFARALKAKIWFIVSDRFQAVLVGFGVYLCYYQSFEQLPPAPEEGDQLADLPCGDTIWDGLVVVLSHQLVGSPAT